MSFCVCESSSRNKQKEIVPDLLTESTEKEIWSWFACHWDHVTVVKFQGLFTFPEKTENPKNKDTGKRSIP